MILKNYIPFACALNIYDVDIEFFKKNNVKHILVDLDNTLDSYKTMSPSPKAIKLKEDLLKCEIDMHILSNNTGKRVSAYANALGVNYANSIGKPFAKGINKFLKEHNFKKDEVMLVGDQLMTDICAANRAHIKSLYVEKLVKEDQITTRFNRIFEKPIKNYLKKHNLLISWKGI